MVMSELAAKKQIRDIAAASEQIIKNKSFTSSEKEARLDALEVKMAEAKAAISRAKMIRGYCPDGAEAPVAASGNGFALDLEAVKAMHDSVVSHKAFKGEIFTKDAVSPSGAVPPSLLPGILLVNQHEPTRVASLIPSSATSAPSVEYLRHTRTTGAAAITAAGALKPEVTLATDRVVTSVSKIAVFTRLTDEDYQDFTEWQSYVQNELARLIIDAENSQLLNGDGTNGSILGLLHTPGILTRALGSDTALDAVEQAIADLRNGASKVTPDFIVASPSTFSAIRRSKDGYGRYLLSADPSSDQTSQLWGYPVVQTTTIADGTVLIASSQAAQLMIRQSFVIESNYSADDFQRNLTSVRAEERLALLTPRPTAMITVTGLPGAAA